MAAWVQEQGKSNSGASIEQSLQVSGISEKWTHTVTHTEGRPIALASDH